MDHLIDELKNAQQLAVIPMKTSLHMGVRHDRHCNSHFHDSRRHNDLAGYIEESQDG